MDEAQLAFLMARLDEDEVAALKAIGETGTQWHADGHWLLYEHPEEGTQEVAISEMLEDDAIAHAARHDAARVLREVNAIRELVRHLTDPQTEEFWKLAIRLPEGGQSALFADWLIQPFAAVYSDHPDYRQ